MWIITTSSTSNSPYIEISGNLEEGGLSVNRAILILGTKSNSHYQSLLPIELVFHQIVQQAETSELQMEKARKKFNQMTASTFTAQNKSGTSNIPNDPPPDLTDDEATEDEATDDEATEDVVNDDELSHEKNDITKHIEKERKKINEMTVTAFTAVEQPTKQNYPPPDLTDDEATDDEVTDDEANDKEKDETKQKAKTSKVICSQFEPFEYNYRNSKITFTRTSDDYQMRCPNCSKKMGCSILCREKIPKCG